MDEDFRKAALEIVNTESNPPLDECYGVDAVVIPTQSWLSAKAVACMYLAEHPADDDEAADRDWTNKIGGIGWPNVILFSETSRLNLEIRYDDTNNNVYIYLTSCGDEQRVVDIGRIWNGRGLTRGMVRRLCSALFIPLKEK
jgi:hypothetical protein